MINIFRIFVTDVKRIFTNVVAIVVIMGLTVIPCLYAWFNIFSNWDPYGASATGNLPVAVFSEDKGNAAMQDPQRDRSRDQSNTVLWELSCLHML